LRIEIHRTVPDDPRLRDAWNALVDRMECPEVFYTYEWARAVSYAYEKSLQPWLLLVYEATDLVGVAAMAIDSANRASFLNGTTADYCDLVSSPQDRSTLVEMVLSELQKAGIRDIVLANLPEDSATVASVSRLARSYSYHMGSRLGYVCARVDLGSPEQRTKLKAAIKKKKSYRYSMNALARQGPVVLSHLMTWAEVDPALPEFYVAHVARFLATNRVSNIAQVERRIFLTELGWLLSQSGWLALTQMTVGDRPIAWNYGFRFKGSWFYYQPTFETSLEQYSPGVCLLSGVIAEACESPDLQIVDLGLGAEGYKERFAEGTRRTLYVTLSRSHARHLREVTRYRLAEMVKRSPRVESSLRNVVANISATRQRIKGANHGRGVASAVRLLADAVSAREVSFYEWSKHLTLPVATQDLDCLVPIDFRTLATAVMAYVGDDHAQGYLLRAARRLSSSEGEGFAVTCSDGRPVEFYWVAAFEGFFMEELQTHLSSPNPRAVLIYDGFTPDAARRTGPCGVVIPTLVERLLREGKVPWASVAGGDQFWARELERAGFVLRYTMVSRRTPAGRKLTRVSASSPSFPTTPVRS
jgi:CelD/BcsL family acetyltransferase involved in cellulose biosynthesis